MDYQTQKRHEQLLDWQRNYLKWRWLKKWTLVLILAFLAGIFTILLCDLCDKLYLLLTAK